ncbi:MAG TPA: M15 family metallopeptidase, partial [Verrucomicrobiae bacterium]|nr:M15 family metallopeptidase [Verrucomicrobiae bacterium]
GLVSNILTRGGSFVPCLARGSDSVLSNHAFDINMKWNALGAAGDVRREGGVRELVQIANRHGLFLGHYGMRLDAMHFEVARVSD